MANNKKLLNEATVRRFQALAAIPGLKESHGRGQHEDDGDYVSGREDLEEGMHEDELEEEMDMSDDYDMSSLMEAEEEEEEVEEETEDEGEEEDEDMPEMDMDDMGDVGAGASAGAGDVEGALQKALKAMADVLGQELNVSIDVVGSGEAGKEMGAAPAGKAPAAPMGGEEVPPPEEETPEMGAMTESVRRLVNKVEKRVKARIQKEMLEEALLKRVAKRLLEAKKVEPTKKPAAPAKKPVAPVKKPVKRR